MLHSALALRRLTRRGCVLVCRSERRRGFAASLNGGNKTSTSLQPPPGNKTSTSLQPPPGVHATHAAHIILPPAPTLQTPSTGEHAQVTPPREVSRAAAFAQYVPPPFHPLPAASTVSE